MTLEEKNEIFKQVQALAIKTNHKMQESFVGNFRSAFSGEGLDFKESKIFSDGDNVKHIDWKTSAKTGKLFIKKFEETRKLKIKIIVDTSSTLNTGFTDLKKNKLIESVSLIIFSVMKSGDKISLSILGEDFSNKNKSDQNIFGTGKNFSFRILEKLISEKFLSKNINYEKKFSEIISNKKNNNSVYFIFSDFSNDENGNNLLENIKKINTNKIGGNQVVCIFIRDNFEELLKNSETNKGISEFENSKDGEKILIDWKRFPEFKNFLDKEIFEKRKDLAKYGIESLEIFEGKNVVDNFLEFFKFLSR